MTDGAQRVVVQRDLWSEELEVGVRYRHPPGRTISESDNVWFSALTMNQQALHVDAAFTVEQEFGKPLVNSLMTLAMVVGRAPSRSRATCQLDSRGRPGSALLRRPI